MNRVRRGLTVLAIMAVVAGVVALERPPTEAAGAGGKALPPLAWTMPAEDVTNTEALLFGRFNPRGSRTVIQFQFGQTRKYGHVTPTYPEEEWFGNEVDVDTARTAPSRRAAGASIPPATASSSATAAR